MSNEYRARVQSVIDRLDELAESGEPLHTAPEIRSELVALRDEPPVARHEGE